MISIIGQVIVKNCFLSFWRHPENNLTNVYFVRVFVIYVIIIFLLFFLIVYQANACLVRDIFFSCTKRGAPGLSYYRRFGHLSFILYNICMYINHLVQLRIFM